MLYTIVPPEVIWQHSEDIVAPEELVYQGQKILAQALPSPGEYKLIQLLSTNPALFLENSFQPGTIIRYAAQEAQKL